MVCVTYCVLRILYIITHKYHRSHHSAQVSWTISPFVRSWIQILELQKIIGGVFYDNWRQLSCLFSGCKGTKKIQNMQVFWYFFLHTDKFQQFGILILQRNREKQQKTCQTTAKYLSLIIDAQAGTIVHAVSTSSRSVQSIAAHCWASYAVILPHRHISAPRSWVEPFCAAGMISPLFTKSGQRRSRSALAKNVAEISN